MRLFTHNFLQCHVRSCTKDNFPLKIQSEDADVQIKTAEFNSDFLALQMCKIDYQALLDVLNEVKEKRCMMNNVINLNCSIKYTACLYTCLHIFISFLLA